MQIQVEDLSPVEKKLSVTIPWDRVKEKLEKAYRELGKDAQLRGFRKGKVPRSVLEQVFGKSVHREVARELVGESFAFAADQHRIEPVAEPVVEEGEIKKGKDFQYSARVEIRGPIELSPWEGIEVTRRPIKVDDHDLEHAIEHMRMEHAEYRAIEGRTVTSDKDEVKIAVKGTVGELPVDRPELAVDLGHTDHEPLPGISKALTGIPLDAKDHEVRFDIPADHEQAEIAGKTATLTVSVLEAREKILPALDDEFAKDTGEADTLADLRAKVRGRFEDRAKQEIDREVRQAVLKKLVEANPIPVAATLVERGIDSQVQRTRYQFAMQGLDLEQAGIDMGRLRESMRETATHEIQGQLILEAIADQHELSVSDSDVDARVAELAKMRDRPAGKLKAEMQKSGDLDSLKWRLRQDKALDLVVSKAKISEE